MCIWPHVLDGCKIFAHEEIPHQLQSYTSASGNKLIPVPDSTFELIWIQDRLDDLPSQTRINKTIYTTTPESSCLGLQARIKYDKEVS